MYAGVPINAPVCVSGESSSESVRDGVTRASSVSSSATAVGRHRRRFGRAVVAEPAREPEVGDEHAAVARAQHVVRLEVAMHEAGRVCGGEPAPGGEQRAPHVVARRLVLEPRIERRALDELHRDEVASPPVPTSYTVTTFGCVSRAIARASRSNRLRSAGLADVCVAAP